LLLEKFSHNVILLLVLRLELLDLFVFRSFLLSYIMAAGLAFEDDHTILEKVLQPWMMMNDMNLVLIHKRRDRNAFQIVFPDDRDLLLRCSILAFQHSGFSLRNH
jgi:hypothetical protein